MNKGAGHAVPTGMPGRRVILELEMRDSDGKTLTGRRSYGAFYADAKGDTITRDSGYFGKDVRLLSDSRIRPDERRTEGFRFPVPAAATAYLDLKLYYEHAPTGGAEDRTLLTFYSESRTVAPGNPAGH